MAKSLLVADPSKDGPQFLFGLNVPNVAAYSDTLAQVPGPPSVWHVSEWDTPQILDPAIMIRDNAADADPFLGKAVYSWTTPNKSIDLSVYGSPGSYFYRLSDFNGSLATGGGQNLFLNADIQQGALNSFDHKLTFDATEGLVNTGSKGVAQQVGNNFTVAFNLPGSPKYNPAEPVLSGFLQIPLSDSRGIPTPFSSFWTPPFCFNVTGVTSLPFSNSTQLSHVSIDLNLALSRMLAAYGRSSSFPDAPPVPSDLSDISKWSLTSVFIGDESLDGGGLSLDVGNVQITSDPAQALSLPSAPVVSISKASLDEAPAPSMSTVLIADTTMGVTKTDVAQDYTGPVEALKHSYSWTAVDGVAMIAKSDDMLIVGGPSNDAITVAGGTNVIDARGGSNFLVGASGVDGGHDTFFIDAADASDTWTTIVNFHPGDMLTLWGFEPQKSTATWVAETGAVGYQGATLRIQIDNGGPTTSVTLAGVSAEQAASNLSSLPWHSADGAYLLIRE